MNRIRVYIVDDSFETRENVKIMIGFSNNLEVVGEAGNGKKAVEDCLKVKPDVVLMDVNLPGMDGLTATQAITSSNPEVGIIIMSVQGEKEYFRKAMFAGARDYLVKPFSTEDLTNAIVNTHETHTNRTKNNNETKEYIHSHVFSVFSTKGGVGKTTIASNLAVALARNTKKRVALIDLDLQFGDIAVMLNLSVKNTIVDLVRDIQNIDPEMAEDYLVTHFSGVNVLPAPTKPEYADFIDNSHVERIIKMLNGIYHYIIIDLNASFYDTVLTALDMSERVLYVSTLDLPTIKNIKVGLDVMESLKYSKEKIRVIVNKASEQYGIKYKEFEETIGHDIWGFVPEDSHTVITSANKGLPFVMSRSEAKVSKAIYSIAEGLIQKENIKKKKMK